MDKYVKYFAGFVILTSVIGGYFVLQYKVDTLINQVSTNQVALSAIIVQVAVISAKLEDK